VEVDAEYGEVVGGDPAAVRERVTRPIGRADEQIAPAIRRVETLRRSARRADAPALCRPGQHRPDTGRIGSLLARGNERICRRSAATLYAPFV
jgi:hypothetical protein